MKGAILIRDLAIGHCQIIGFSLNRICIVCLILMVTNIIPTLKLMSVLTSAENATYMV